MRAFQLIIYKKENGAVYWTEGFDTEKDLKVWLKDEQSRPYWKKEFKVEVVDNTEAIKEADKKRAEELKAIEESEKQKRQETRALIKAFKEKPSKTIADVVKVLDLVLKKLDLDDEVQSIK